MFNAVPTFHQYHFSAMEMITFFSIGYLNRDLVPITNNGSVVFKALIPLMLSLSVVWFIYHAYAHNKYFQALKHLKTKDYGKTITDLEEVYHPVFKTTHDFRNSIDLKLGELFVKTGDFNSAEARFKNAIELNPTFGKHHYKYGVFLQQQERYSEALKALEKAYKLHSLNQWTLYELGRTHTLIGDSTNALKYLEELKQVQRSVYPSASILIKKLENFILKNTSQ